MLPVIGLVRSLDPERAPELFFFFPMARIVPIFCALWLQGYHDTDIFMGFPNIGVFFMLTPEERMQQEDLKRVSCSECATVLVVSSVHDSVPNDGFIFNPKSFGYYAGFTDFFPWEEPKKEDYLFFCHDCCVRLLKLFPSIAKAIGPGGHHPCPSDTPCCLYAWRGTKDFARNYEEFLVRTQRPQVDPETLSLVWVDDPPEKGYT